MKRIQRKRTKGWRMPDNAKYVGRPGRWGNPFVVGLFLELQYGLDEDGTSVLENTYVVNRDGIIVFDTVDWLASLPNTMALLAAVGIGNYVESLDDMRVIITPEIAVDLFRIYVIYDGEIEEAKDKLAGHDLACWCPLDKPCHADVWLEVLSDER